MHYAKWFVMIALVALVALAALGPLAEASGSNAAAAQRLKMKSIDVSYDGHTLKEVVADISQKSGVTIVIDPRVKDSIDPDDVTVGQITFRQMEAYSVLKTIVDQFELTITFKYGMVWVTTPEYYYEGRNMLRIYDVRDITVQIRNYPGMKIRLRGNESGGGTGPVWEEDEPLVEPIEVDELQELIPEFTGGDSWEINPEAKIETIAGILIVRQVPEVHVEIMKFLNQLRACR